ncbi:MAG: nucleotidyltransferase domain-containing protein [Rhodovibrionaceae bacterium]|nr:nucleotidyltransferase domain-containing protein [Rhodovibrionaceae bacterium]
MDKKVVIDVLKSHEEEIRAQGVQAVYLFGSTAREDAGRDSDIDIFVDHDENFSLLDLSGLKLYLDELFDADVDVTTRDSLHPMLKDDIVRQAEKVL